MPSSFPTSPVAGAAPRTGTSGPGRAAGLATTARMS